MVCCKCRFTNQHHIWWRWMASFSDLFAALYRIFMKILSPILFLAANLLIFSTALLFFLIFLPAFYKESLLLYILHNLLGVYVLINIFFNYFTCAWTAPGSPLYCPDPGRVLGEKVSIVDGRKIYQFSSQYNVAPFVSYRYCTICKCIKPPRAHHCR